MGPLRKGLALRPGWLAQSERRFLRRLAARDPCAVQELCERYLEPLTGFVARRMEPSLSGHDVEDVVQQTFLETLRGIGSFDGRAGLFTWLCAIARNQISHRWRKIAAAGLSEPPDGVTEALAAISEMPLPENVLEAQEVAEMVRGVMNRLDERHRVLLELRYIDQMSSRQTAALLGDSVRAVRSATHRAREAFREAFLTAVRRAGRQR